MTHRYCNFFGRCSPCDVTSLRGRGTELPNANSRTPRRKQSASKIHRPPLATRRPYSSTYVYSRIRILFCKTNSDMLKRAPSLLESVLQLVTLAVIVAGCVQRLEIFKRQCVLESLSLKYRLCADLLSPRDARLPRDGFSSNFIPVIFLLAEIRKNLIKRNSSYKGSSTIVQRRRY